METTPSPLRRTKSVTRKAVRDILRPVIPDTFVLELFAGSARISQDFLEEGARRALAVEVREPPEAIRNQPGLDWYRGDVFDFLLEGPEEPVDIVFMDPPYGSEVPERVLDTLTGKKWMNDQSIVVVETEVDHPLPVSFKGKRTFHLMRDRHYGNSRVRIYQAGRDQPAPQFQSESGHTAEDG